MSRAAHARPVLLPLAAAGAVAASAAWALWPLRSPPASASAGATERPQPPDAEPPEVVALDTSAFSAPLWIAPPPPPPKPAPEPPAPPPPPLRLQLVGIVVEDGGARAVLYDPDTDVLHIAGSGETVGRCTVEAVTAGEVTLRDAGAIRTLALSDDRVRGRGTR